VIAQNLQEQSQIEKNVSLDVVSLEHSVAAERDVSPQERRDKSSQERQDKFLCERPDTSQNALGK